MLDTQLIEKALGLTWKNMEDMEEVWEIEYEWTYDFKFSIEKFCYYLLSPEFIEKYKQHVHPPFIKSPKTDEDVLNNILRSVETWEIVLQFANGIYLYHEWDEWLLTELLWKI